MSALARRPAALTALPAFVALACARALSAGVALLASARTHPVFVALLGFVALAAVGMFGSVGVFGFFGPFDVMTASAEDRVVLAFGDSLTAGQGVLSEEAYPALLEARLRREGYAYRVINAGVSGDTTAGARRRLAWALRARPSVVIVALGANDGLRGRSVSSMRDDLTAIVDAFADAGARVLLAGMRLPPNYGEPYTRDFAAAFADVARRKGVAFMPFLLVDVAGDPRLNQSDGIHPTAEGQRMVAERLWPYLRPLLRK